MQRFTGYFLPITKKHKASFIFIGILWFGTQARSESLADIYRFALESEPNYLAAIHDYNSVKEVGRQATADWLPTLSLESSETRTRQNIKSSESAFFTQGRSRFPTDSLTLVLRQPVFSWERLARKNQSRFEVLRAHAQYEFAKQELIIKVAESYFEALSKQQDLELISKERTLVETQKAKVDSQYRLGQASSIDTNEAKARASITIADEIDTLNAYEDALQGVQELAGRQYQRQRLQDLVSPRLESPSPNNINEWVWDALENNIELQIANHSIAVTDAEVSVRRGRFYPTVDFVARLNDVDTGGTVFGAGREVSTRELSLNLFWPIYEGGKTSSQVRQAAEQYLSALQTREATKRLVERETRAAFRGISSSIERVQSLEDAVTSQRVALEGKTAGYSSGQNSNIEVLDAQRDLTSVRRELAQAKYEYALNRLRLLFAVGRLSEEDLLEVNSWLEFSDYRSSSNSSAMSSATSSQISAYESPPSESTISQSTSSPTNNRAEYIDSYPDTLWNAPTE